MSAFAYPWEALRGLHAFIREAGECLDEKEFVLLDRGIWAHRSARIDKTARLSAPCILGRETEVRHGAFIRGGVLVGDYCVVGNATELKNCILFDGAKAPHFNYVGDSILGFNAHLGAGSITSNVKSDKSLVVVKTKKERIATGLKKVGAFVGDFAEIGCNSVLNPGTIVGKNALIYPLSSVRGEVEANTLYKGENRVEKRR